MGTRELTSTDLFRECKLEGVEFESTADLEPVDGLIGQDRAVESIRFGVDVRHEGYHIFALGPAGTGKRTLVQQFLEKRAAATAPADDWCYVNNFADDHRPIALRLPAGKAINFRRAVREAIAGVRAALPKAFESENYVQRRKALEETVFAEQRGELEALYKRAQDGGLEVVWTPTGMGFRPMRDGKTLSPEEMESLPDAEKEELGKRAMDIEQAFAKIMGRAPEAQREGRKLLSKLHRDVVAETVEPFFRELRDGYSNLKHIVEYCETMKQDLIDHYEPVLASGHEAAESGETDSSQHNDENGAVQRYAVNVVVDNGGADGAPVVYESNPTYQNLIGRVEYFAVMGALITNFTLIKAGALHRANGGYLVLDAGHVLSRPFVWDGLKRALRSESIRIESPGQEFGLISTISLDPEPIPLKVKVVLLGSRLLYELLSAYDSEFPELFKVPADFETEMDRSAETENQYARLLTSLCRRFDVRHLDHAAVCRFVEYSSRLAGDAQKLSVHMRSVADLLREADYWAGKADHETIGASDVDDAYRNAIKRSSSTSDRVKELMARQILLISTEGDAIGQINGLSVLAFGDRMFGRPVRVTARTRMGEGHVVDIEREVELGGPTHSKGVLILQGFLTGRYTKDIPLSLSASLVFEQSYGFVEGDSASLAELCALISSVADIPVSQSYALTGSVNQSGQVQAIGGVNEKIEGFYDICESRGLTGKQGVIIPASNVQHLMLRPDVIEAVNSNRFHVFAVETVDDAMELLTGIPAGERGEDGRFPPQSINGIVSDGLEALAKRRQEFAPASDGKES